MTQSSKQRKRKRSEPATGQPRVRANKRQKTDLPAATAGAVSPYFRYVRTSKDRVRIQMRSVWDKVTVQPTWTALPINFNPLSARFGRIAGIARGFEFFKIHRASMHYNGACATDVAGQVLIRLDADAADEVPGDMAAFLNSGYSAMCPPYSGASVELLARDLYREWYPCQPWQTSKIGDPSTADNVVRNARPFQLQIVTENGSSVVSGAVYLDLDIEFKTPSEPNVGTSAVGLLGPSTLPSLATSWNDNKHTGSAYWQLGLLGNLLYANVQAPGSYICTVSFSGTSLAPTPFLTSYNVTSSTLVSAGGTTNYTCSWTMVLSDDETSGYASLDIGGTGSINSLTCTLVEL